MLLVKLLTLLPAAAMAQHLGRSPGAALHSHTDATINTPDPEESKVRDRGENLAHTPTEDEAPSKVIKRTYCWHSDGVRYCSSSSPTATSAANATASDTAAVDVPTGGTDSAGVNGGLVVMGVIGALLV